MQKKSKKFLSLIVGGTIFIGSTALSPLHTSAAENLLAFPGAVGAGKYATGGRGGTVYHVTNLNDSGEGSFRDAVSKSNRIVVFDVSGTIELKGNVTVADNVTIAGQTAPGGSGITLKNYKIGMAGDNIICRFISSRPGPYASTSSGNDAWGGEKGSKSIIDHCSMGWTTDEQWGLYSKNKNTTVQYSVIGPADSWGGHSKGVHGFGIMMPGTSTFDHNLIIHNVSRNFRGKIGGTETCDFTNNVIYNWGYQTAYGTIGHLNYVGNTLKIGPDTTDGFNYINIDSSTNPQNFSVYATGNRMINKDNTNYGTLTEDNWSGIKVKDGLGITKDNVYSESYFPTYNSSIDMSTVPDAESAEDSYEHVITFAGNGISSDKRTAIDRQCAYETKTGTGTLSGTSSYDSASADEKSKIDKYGIECGVTYEYPKAVLTKEIVDNDNDGMDDDWEKERGLNPSDPSDTNGDYCGKGYTNIEYYINDLTVNAFPEGVVTLSPKTTPSAPEAVKGDINLDGTLNISDVILLQKWFISADNTTISNLNVTDLNGNGKTDIADMCMLKQLLIDSVY
ncbi:MAG: dockerin type I repeat-containing protein [Oscillospiraceae bacterium]|nr:dockerin type I repeat-containing protein [Oscillospiraceae bacterium]